MQINNSEDAYAAFTKLLDEVEGELSLPRGFLRSLALEDDWSFIIKAHALLEAVLTTQLCSVLDSRLRPVFERLELSDVRTGKIAFADALELVESDEKLFVRKLSEIRNSVVHDIRKIQFNLSDYLSTLDTNQQKSLFNAILHFARTEEATNNWQPFLISNPKLVIWAGTTFFLIRCLSGAARGRAERERTKLALELADHVSKTFKSN